MNIQIGKLPEERWKDFQDLRLESLQQDSIAFGSSFEEERKFPEDKWKRRLQNCLFAFVDDRPVGMITFVVSDRLKTSHIANIYAMYVKKEFRGKRIGTKLITEALRILKDHKEIIKINLSVNPKQTSARRLYERVGFKKVGKFSKNAFIDGEFQDELMMELFFE